MRPFVEIGVIWDGTRVYRVPHPGEIQAIHLMSEGHEPKKVSQLLGLNPEGAQHRSVEAQTKLRAQSPADALYQMYRLGILDNPRRENLSPVLDPMARDILNIVVRLGMTHVDAAPMIGIGRTQLVRRLNAMNEALGASNRVQALRRAVETGDIEIPVPAQLWRGVV